MMSPMALPITLYWYDVTTGITNNGRNDVPIGVPNNIENDVTTMTSGDFR